jgi:nucleotide-binding universal stress UspA family protein
LQLQRRLEAEGFQVTTEIDRGDPAERIISRAHEVDLIAMATHGRSGLGRLLLGSVAETVLKQSHVPVLMFNPPPRLAEETLPQHSLAVS